MWLCYTIRKEDNFKHLSVITENLQEIFDFITNLVKNDNFNFSFEIQKE